MRSLAAQFKELRHSALNPNPEWVARNRATLLSQIKNTVPVQAPKFVWENTWVWLSAFMPRRFVFNFVRPMAVLVIVALVGTSGAIAAVDASYEALPGDFLYPASRVAQKTQIAFVSLLAGKDAEAKARTKAVQQLAVKTQKIIKINDDKKNERLTIAVADLKSEIAGLSDKLDENKNNPAHPINTEVVKDVKSNSDQVKSVLQEVKNDLLTTASTTVSVALTKAVNETKDLAKDVSVKAVGVLVTNHVNGGSGTTDEDIKQVLVAAAQTAATDAGTSQQNVNDIKTMVDSIKNESKDHSKNSPTTTFELAQQINSVSNQTVAAIIKTDAAANDATLKANEAEKFAASGDFVKAIDKIKEASDASKVVEKISDAAALTAHEVAPVVAVIKEGVVADPIFNTASGTLTLTSTVKFVNVIVPIQKVSTTTEK